MSASPIHVEKHAADDVLPPDISRYCQRHGIAPHLKTAMHLVAAALAPEHVELWLQTDPDTGEVYLIIEARVRGTMDGVLRAEDQYTRQWVKSAPPEALERIRLLCDIELDNGSSGV